MTLGEEVGSKFSRILIVVLTASPLLLLQTGPAGALGPLDGKLVNHASDAGFSEVGRTWSADVADYNGDGLQDFMYIRHNPQLAVQGLPMPRPTLYKATPSGRYVDSGIGFQSRDRHKCTWGDIDLDTDLDIFCAIGLTAGSENELRLQLENGSFSSDQAPAFGLTRNTFGRYRTASFVHANFDRYPDIYVTRYYGSNNSMDDPSEPDPYPNELWINRNGKSFVRDASFKMDLRVGAPKEVRNCNRPIDYNRDGWEDLLVCGLTRLHIFRNNGGTSFTNVAEQLNVSHSVRDAEYADFNGDAHGDLVWVNAGKIKVQLWNGTKFGTPVYSKVFPEDSRSGQDVTIGDFNGDNLRDVYLVRNCPRTHKLVDDPDMLLLGDGRGQFTVQTIPAIPKRKGCGNTASTIDWNHVGGDDLLVLNGHKLRAGPNQLFAWEHSITP
jgi:FG-GAP-like repeat